MSEKVAIWEGISYIYLHEWATTNKVRVKLARKWAYKGLIPGAQKAFIGGGQLWDGGRWVVPLKAKVPAVHKPRKTKFGSGESSISKSEALRRALKLFRPRFVGAYLDYEHDLGMRARWSKEEIMEACRWPFISDWRSLRNCLEKELGLIMLRPGAGNPWSGEAIKVWTFATCQADREWGITNAVALQLGGMKRTAKVTSMALEPGDERYALDEGSKARIDEALKKQDVKLDSILQTLQGVKQDLLDRQTMELLAEYGE